jgi:hypothetical protein
LIAQQIARPRFTEPSEVVEWMGAVQAQDYLASKWAIGVRLERSTDEMIERAIDEGSILRTHLFRGTWQLVVPRDVRWMLALVGPRSMKRAERRHQDLGIDAKTLSRTYTVLTKALSSPLTRHQIAAALQRARISTEGQRLSHLLGAAELEGVITSGPQRTFMRLDDRAPKAKTLARDEAIAELARRYFQSHGPATIEDFVWWSGLSATDARPGIADLASETIDGSTYYFLDDQAVRAKSVHLLPAFDEYLVAYKRRDAVLAPEHVKRVNAGGGLLAPAIVVGGRVIGTWRRTIAKESVAIELQPFTKTRVSIDAALRRYVRFLGLELTGRR